jgi:hypothetical protein
LPRRLIERDPGRPARKGPGAAAADDQGVVASAPAGLGAGDKEGDGLGHDPLLLARVDDREGCTGAEPEVAVVWVKERTRRRLDNRALIREAT